MATKKVYIGSVGPYLYDDTDNVDDPDGDFAGQMSVAALSNHKFVATEFIGIPISSVSVTNIDDPSTELNPLSASDIGGLVAVYQATAAADDEFTMYLWDTDAAAENVPYSVDGTGGVWIAVGGKYLNGDLYVENNINWGGAIGAHASTHENGGADEVDVGGLSGLLADDQHVLDSEVESVITAELVDGQSIDNAIDSLISTHASDADAHITLSEGAITLLGSAAVDLQNGDSKTTVYTVPTGKTMVVTHVVIRSPSGTLAGGTDFDIGSGANADTWRQTINLSSMTATDDYMVIPSVSATPVKYTLEAAGSAFGILPVTGATADVTATMEVFGYLF